jgi:hypothetical protein
MVLSITISDELYAKYVAMNPQNPHKAIQKQLDRFSEVTPGLRAIVLSGDDLSELQRLAQKSVETPKEVVKLVGDALTIQNEGVEVQISEGQRARLRQEASFWGQDPGKYASDALKTAMHARFGT